MLSDRFMDLQYTEEFNTKEPSKQFGSLLWKKFINKATPFSLKH